VPAPITLSGADESTKLFSGNTVQEATLRVVQGSFAGTECALGAGTVVIGRSSDCELSLKGAQGVSRRHCKVQYLSDRFVVVDLESRNGTIVNGQSVERKVLEPGDRIEVGDEHIIFVVESLASLRAAPLGDAAIEDAETALVSQAPSLLGNAAGNAAGKGVGHAAGADGEPTGARTGPTPAKTFNDDDDNNDDDDDGLQETLPPSAVTDPFRQRRVEAQPHSPPPPQEPELSSPYQHQAPPPGAKSKAPLIFALLCVVIVALAAFLVRDIFADGDGAGDVVAGADGDADGDVVVVASVAADAGAADAVVDAGAAVAAVDVAVADAGVAVEVVVDAGAADVAVDAGAADDVVVADAADAVHVVRAKGGGRAANIAVKVGDRVKVGAALLVVNVDNASMARKIEALRREEREFAEVAKKIPAAKADLDAVRAELRRAEARMKPKTIVSDSAGVVTEILVEVGGVVRDGAPIVKLSK
jgi:pSer/pThr/pTyr-binding forkhead associated (FHA) protein/biotin carboxyl carrier protein